MTSMKKIYSIAALAAAVGVGALAMPAAAHADRFNISLGGGGYYGGGYAPVYYQPAPVYYRPYYRPAYYRPYYGGYGYGGPAFRVGYSNWGGGYHDGWRGGGGYHHWR